MTTLYESFLKGPETIMTLTSDHDYPKILKDMMKHILLEGDAVYKGYPFMENGVELWPIPVISFLSHLPSVHVFQPIDSQYLRLASNWHDNYWHIGAFVVYLEPWHADIFEFLDLRRNHGKIYLIHLKSTLSYRCLCKS
ncbi:Ribonucleotide reductase 1 isoform 2 [Hordeum vulgare]|nr:Ribonucleotide reductase 1 isoform 2 [Hordeum vulgare]